MWAIKNIISNFLFTAITYNLIHMYIPDIQITLYIDLFYTFPELIILNRF